ncbi:UNVERIFIED_CONTAM: Bifunctional bis(5'-adenosyl)-triphosphatase/adenylylsulfatase FHIT [Sesamum radiatum]|uniref:Bifunctional bis(5'-adenosyl)-triphosphatase/adenylylsulfatase FHIT n=1 Tax=Sesamum radiatum TaxID=300843 RepID=A0AAW2W8U9_SESRA
MESESYTFGPYKISAKEVFYSTQLSYALVNLRPVVPGHFVLDQFRAPIYDFDGNFGIGTSCRVCSLSFAKFTVLRSIVVHKSKDGFWQGNDSLLDRLAQCHDNKMFDSHLSMLCMLTIVMYMLSDQTAQTCFGPSQLGIASRTQKIGHQLESYHNASSLTFTIQDGPQAGQTVPHVHIHILPRKSGDFENNDEIYEAIDSKEKELKQKLDLDKERKDRSMEEMAQEAAEYRKLFP